MKITFLGTRGNIDAHSRWHKRHTSTLVAYRSTKILIDCGKDWLHHLDDISCNAVLLTHAHDDHADGLKEGSPWPVYATKESWQVIKRFPIENKHIIKPRVPFKIGSLTIETFDVEHSLLAPGVGYRITGGKKTIFCVHDLVAIKERADALKGVSLYIGDGATIARPLIRLRDHTPIGHTTVKTQFGWCQKEGVPRAIITHCGSGIVESNAKMINNLLKNLGKERGIRAEVAYDGMEVIIR